MVDDSGIRETNMMKWDWTHSGFHAHTARDRRWHCYEKIGPCRCAICEQSNAS